MASTPLFDGPFSQPFREADRWPGAKGVFVNPEKQQSGNLPANPTDNPVRNPTPFKNLRTGR